MRRLLIHLHSCRKVSNNKKKKQEEINEKFHSHDFKVVAKRDESLKKCGNLLSFSLFFWHNHIWLFFIHILYSIRKQADKSMPVMLFSFRAAQAIHDINKSYSFRTFDLCLCVYV